MPSLDSSVTSEIFGNEISSHAKKKGIARSWTEKNELISDMPLKLVGIWLDQL